MNFCDETYFGESIKNPEDYLYKLNNHKLHIPFFVVCLESNGDIACYNSIQFIQKGILGENKTIICLTKDEGEAMDYLVKITAFSLNAYGNKDYVKAVSEFVYEKE